MNLKNTPRTYGKATKILHGLVAIFLPLLLAAGAIMRYLPDNTPALGAIYNIHKLSGLAVLCLMVVFFTWSISQTKPLYPHTMATWEKTLAKIIRYGLYAAVIAMSLSGWLMASAAHHAPHLFHWHFQLPLAKNKALAKQLAIVHLTLAWTITALLSLHIVGALKHHFVNKNNILRRMWWG